MRCVRILGDGRARILTDLMVKNEGGIKKRVIVEEKRAESDIHHFPPSFMTKMT